MNLAIDIGNYSAKLGCFYDGQLINPSQSVPLEEIYSATDKLNPNNMIISSVVEKPQLPELEGMVIELSSTTRLPFNLDYNTINTLGVDRIAAAAGAMVINPSADSLIIDAGSCFTYDVLEGGTNYAGGIISPGGRLRLQSMNHYTKNLPLIELTDSIGEKWEIPAKSTVTAMKSGVIEGLTFEILGFIEKYKEKYPDIKVILCGGEAKLFENRLKASIFAVPELVLIGLNRILEYNLLDENDN